jgi:hypothetical protein
MAPGRPAVGWVEKRRQMIESGAVIVRNPRVEYRKLAEGGGSVLLNLDTAAYHGLNQTGSLIWEAVGDGRPVGEVVPEVASVFEDAPATLAAEVTTFIEDLIERDLLRVAQVGSSPGSSATGSAERGS